jgi:hypothetical protein
LRQRLAEAFMREKIHVPFPVCEAERPAGLLNNEVDTGRRL